MHNEITTKSLKPEEQVDKDAVYLLRIQHLLHLYLSHPCGKVVISFINILTLQLYLFMFVCDHKYCLICNVYRPFTYKIHCCCVNIFVFTCLDLEVRQFLGQLADIRLYNRVLSAR